MDNGSEHVKNENPLLAALRSGQEELKERARKHEQVRQSPDYQEALLQLRATAQGLCQTLRMCELAASRWQSFTDNYLFPRHIDDIVEAAITAQMAIENGALNPARRELRHMLEVAVNTAYVDEQAAKADLDGRLALYRSKKVNKINVDHVAELPLRMLGDKREAFIDATRKAWVSASNYVHLTKRRVDEKLALRAQGVQLGFETTSMLQDVVREVHGVCSIVVVLAFETIGPSFTGDLLVDGLDSNDQWPFHESEFIAVVDSHFDYKHERQTDLEHHVEQRKARVRKGVAPE